MTVWADFLYLENNKLIGPIPTEIGVLTSLGECVYHGRKQEYAFRSSQIAL
jgi:hypothetical protein